MGKQSISVVVAPTIDQFKTGLKAVLDEPGWRIVTISHNVAAMDTTHLPCALHYSAIILQEQEN